MDLKDIWQSVLNDIELNISRASFITWFKNSSLIKKDGSTVVVACHNSFTKEWLENKYHKLILKSLRNTNTEIKAVEYDKILGKQASQDIKKDVQLKHEDIK